MFCVIKITPALNQYKIAADGLYHHEAKMIAMSRNQFEHDYFLTYKPNWYPINGCRKFNLSYHIACHRNNIEQAVHDFMESNQDLPKVKRYYINR